jgi:membrane-associated phospholipid phosphatase
VSSPPPEASRITRPRALAVVAACFALVTLLGIGVFADFAPQMDLDGIVSEAFYAGDDRAATLDLLLEVLTAPGGAAGRTAVLLPVVVLLLLRRRAWTALWVSVAVAGIGPLTTLLKELFGRIRPDFDQGGARLDSLSYPSGHSSGIATMVTVALLLLWPLVARRWRSTVLVLSVALVALVGLTRMWLGVHFLSDVIGGWALGIGWTLLVATLLHGLPGERAALPRRDTAVTG